MRLNIPVETTSLEILNGPGSQKLLDATIEKDRMGYDEPRGPKLEFTVESPIDGQKIKVTTELMGNLERVSDHYEFLGWLLGSNDVVLVKYWLRDAHKIGRGSISDPS